MTEQASIFRKDFTLDSIHQMGNGTLTEALGIKLVEIGPDFNSSNVNFHFCKNGELMQKGNSGEMIFTLISK